MTRRKKILLGVVVAMLALAASGYVFMRKSFQAPPNQLVLSTPHGQVQFVWTEDDFGGVVEPHSSILLPVTLQTPGKTFYMQFDLGAPSSVLYHDTVMAIQARLPVFTLVEEDQRNYAIDTQLTAGGIQISLKRARLTKSAGNGEINWEDDTGVVVIGTIGSDLLDGRVLTIDYPNRSLSVAATVPSDVASTPSAKLDYKERRVILAAEFEGAPTKIMLDTGSSSFALLTSESTWLRVSAGGTNARKFGVNSWGDTLTAHVADTAASIGLGGSLLPLKNVTYIEGTSVLQNLLMRMSGMSGMTGNKLLLDKTLVLDPANSRYWVLNSPNAVDKADRS